MDKKEAIKELKFEKNISAGVMEQLGTTKALREIVAIQQKKRTQTYDTAIEALEKQIPINWIGSKVILSIRRQQKKFEIEDETYNKVKKAIKEKEIENEE